MTGIVDVRDAAEKALDVLIAGQNRPGGGLNYGLKGSGNDEPSVMGRAAQALKAGTLAKFTNEGLDEAVALAIKGFQKNADPKAVSATRAPVVTG